MNIYFGANPREDGKCDIGRAIFRVNTTINKIKEINEEPQDTVEFSKKSLEEAARALDKSKEYLGKAIKEDIPIFCPLPHHLLREWLACKSYNALEDVKTKTVDKQTLKDLALRAQNFDLLVKRITSSFPIESTDERRLTEDLVALEGLIDGLEDSSQTRTPLSQIAQPFKAF